MGSGEWLARHEPLYRDSPGVLRSDNAITAANLLGDRERHGRHRTNSIAPWPYAGRHAQHRPSIASTRAARLTLTQTNLGILTESAADNRYHPSSLLALTNVGLTWGTVTAFGGVTVTGIVLSDINSAGNTSRSALSEATLVGKLLTKANVYDAVKAIIGAGANITVTPEDSSSTLAISGQAAGGMGASSWLGLSDTPATFLNQAGNVVRVNARETGLEFVTLPAPPPGDMTLAVLATALSGGLTTVNPVPTLQQDFLLMWDTSAMALARTGVGDLASVIVAANPTTTSATLTSLTVAGIHYALPAGGGGPDTNSFVTDGAFTFTNGELSLQLTGNTGFTTIDIPAIPLPAGMGGGSTTPNHTVLRTYGGCHRFRTLSEATDSTDLDRPDLRA